MTPNCLQEQKTEGGQKEKEQKKRNETRRHLWFVFFTIFCGISRKIIEAESKTQRWSLFLSKIKMWKKKKKWKKSWKKMAKVVCFSNLSRFVSLDDRANQKKKKEIWREGNFWETEKWLSCPDITMVKEENEEKEKNTSRK